MLELHKSKTFLFILILTAFLLTCFCMPTVSRAQEEWVKVQTFTGQGDKTTAPFHISGSEWRINWTAVPESPEFGGFGFFVYPEGETASYVESIDTPHGSGSDTTYIYEGKGNFYVKVFAANESSWTIEIEDNISKSATPEPVTPKPSSGDSGGKSGCFIATAAYGTPAAKEIAILREFRDKVLLRNSVGDGLVDFYYRTSPPIADIISRHAVLRTIVREAFVDPIVAAMKSSKPMWDR